VTGGGAETDSEADTEPDTESDTEAESDRLGARGLLHAGGFLSSGTWGVPRGG